MKRKKMSGLLNPSNWGAILFSVTLIAMLIFFWWLLIYSGGVTIHHG